MIVSRKLIWKSPKIIKTVFACCFCLFLFATTAFAKSANHFKTNVKKVADLVWGVPSPAQIHFYPVGYHFFSTKHPNNKQWLVAGVYKGFTAGTFVNSCNQRVFYEALDRTVYDNKLLSINYILGVMEGYGGKCGLKDLGPIIGHDPGPLAVLDFKLSLTEHLAVDVLTYGMGALGGISYIF